jgi:heme-degrading monooxygenase HmoA
MHTRIAKYTFTGDAQELARRAEEGMLPIFQAQPGFKAYTLVSTGEKIISFSAWDSAESAEAAGTAAADWIQENMADSIELKDAHIGEVLFSTVLGVSTLSGASA